MPTFLCTYINVQVHTAMPSSAFQTEENTDNTVQTHCRQAETYTYVKNVTDYGTKR